MPGDLIKFKYVSSIIFYKLKGITEQVTKET